MLNHNELTRGTFFILDGKPHEVLQAVPFFRGRGSSVQQTKVRNLITGAVLQKTFHAGETFEGAELSKTEIRFVYARNEKYVFSYADNPGKRFELAKEQLGGKAKFLLPDTVLEGMLFEGEVLDISLPIKMQFKVIQAPPGIQGDRAQGGTKTVILEGGVEIAVPLFVQEDDAVEVNTETGEYVRRMPAGGEAKQD